MGESGGGRLSHYLQGADKMLWMLLYSDDCWATAGGARAERDLLLHLLVLGVIGTPILGVQFDKQIHAALTEKAPAFAEVATAPGSFLGGSHNMIAPGIKVTADEDANKNGILDREELIGPEGNPILTATWGYMDGLSAEDNAALRATYDEEEELAGRSVLVYATRFPLMLVLVFGVIFLYFRSKGGYKPIELTEEDPT